MRRSSDQDSAELLRLVSVAMLVLTVAGLVYVLDRPSGSAYLLPQFLRPGSKGIQVFGELGNSLPSLAHAFAMSIFTGLVLPRTRGFAALACGCWATIDSLFELGQHRSVAPVILNAIGDRFRGVPVLDHLGLYLENGVFDPVDLVAGLAGALLAFGVLRFSWARNDCIAR